MKKSEVRSKVIYADVAWDNSVTSAENYTAHIKANNIANGYEVSNVDKSKLTSDLEQLLHKIKEVN